MKIKYTFLALALLSFLLSNCQDKKELTKLTTAEWLEDVRFFKKEIEDKHINAFHHQSKESWDKKFSEFERELPGLTSEQIMTGLMTLGALVGDGHTAARPYNYFRRFPITFTWFGNDLIITRISANQKSALGAKVVKIAETPLEEAYLKVVPLIPNHESPSFVLGWSEYLFRMETVLLGTGILKKPGTLHLTIKNADGNIDTISLPLEDTESTSEKVWAYDPLPLFISTSEKSPYYEWMPNVNNVLYFNFERYPDWNQMKEFGIGLIKFIQENKVEKLIVDMRENEGGDFNKGLKLIEELKKTYLNVPGKVYVITGRNTFSAGMSNAAHFKTMLQATLVGEVTGGRPVGYQENYSFILPNSGIPASCSIKHYEFLKDDTDGIIPDKIIDPDFAMYKNGNDPAIDWILNQ